MTEREERDLAHRLTENSNVFDFDRALEVVKLRPAEAEKLVRMDEQFAKRQEERAQARERLRQTFIEEFG
jgi:hypothetical protein